MIRNQIMKIIIGIICALLVLLVAVLFILQSGSGKTYEMIKRGDIKVTSSEIIDTNVCKIKSVKSKEVGSLLEEDVYWKIQTVTPGVTYLHYEDNGTVYSVRMEVDYKLRLTYDEPVPVDKITEFVIKDKNVTIYKNQPMEIYESIQTDDNHVKFIEMEKLDRNYNCYAYKFEFDRKKDISVYFNKKDYTTGEVANEVREEYLFEKEYKYAPHVARVSSYKNIVYKYTPGTPVVFVANCPTKYLKTNIRIEDNTIVSLQNLVQQEYKDEFNLTNVFFEMTGLKEGKTKVFFDRMNIMDNTSKTKEYTIIVKPDKSIEYYSFDD